MKVYTSTIQVRTRGETDIIDITERVKEKVTSTQVTNGSLLLFIPGSTAALTTIEAESGVMNDLRKAIERIVPRNIPYEHDKRWKDGNGYAHVRAALIGPSLNIPILDKQMILGTWQQIVLLDFDNRPRNREVVIQIIGE
jgi:secondary thiamine-phosphate synthase enzyme